ncbi:putative TetR family transcriptional regulator [Caenibius tardaugens NBRC 16725]|uniref:Putative TetR family transcriptional regulator n=1 Tax=Caenibius tardaugens NBRC 16725 TaxID=1219035 RepID=U2YIC1_9SPHN|nr:TetR/AcrR family transcriptional regulator [Caenibius tardaugens]GAD47807.1 putative TetR family transcriptional regulator [Caenibius tardaugens NBRC 16725]
MTDSSARRRRGRPPLDDENAVDEQECLRVALEAFAQSGFDGTSVREVARTLNISHGLLNAKFGSKRALWEAAVDHGMETLHAHMSRLPEKSADAGDIVERMRIACRNFVVGLTEMPAIVRLMNVEGASPSDRLDHIATKFFRRRTWPLQILLREGQQAGLFRNVHPTVPFTLLAHGAGALVALRPLLHAADAAQNNPIQDACEAADIIVQGLLVDRALMADSSALDTP